MQTDYWSAVTMACKRAGMLGRAVYVVQATTATTGNPYWFPVDESRLAQLAPSIDRVCLRVGR